MRLIESLMMSRRKYYLFITISCLFFWLKSSNAQQPMAFGVNGHPFTQHDYRANTWKYQIDALKALNVDYYRVDVMVDKNGLIKRPSLFFSFFKELSANKIQLMPVLKPVYADGLDSMGVYSGNFDLGKQFGEHYADLFKVVEVGNELDVALMKKNGKGGDGRKAGQYDLEKNQHLMWRLKGFIDGLKSVSPKIKVSLSFSWVHTYYLDLLAQYSVDYDIIGAHWYSNMGDITAPRQPYQRLLPELETKYQKTIWITEFNSHKGTKEKSMQYQEDYLANSLSKIVNQGIVSGFFVYELFDQPALRRIPDETAYGLILLNERDGSYSEKPAFTRFKQLIQMYKKP